MVCRTDPAQPVIDAVSRAIALYFAPGGQCPAEVGTTTSIRFFAGDGPPLAAWDSHSSAGADCSEPFVWVRAMRRYRSRSFPAPTIATDCEMMKVIAVEIGVGWCAVVDQEPRWEDYAREAVISMDTAWRVEEALCQARRMLLQEETGDTERLVGTDTLVPYGPEGGVIAWTGVIYASYS